MPIPSQPQNLLSQPFANQGSYQIIPDASANAGRASLAQGFPVETQRPLSNGGIAPNRLDFNGMFYMLSAAMFWQQSGGQWAYLPTLNYTVPNIVFHNGVMWWCMKENGADSTNGPVEPGSNEEYWLELLKALAQMGGGGTSFGNPVGTVITFWGTSAPDGYLACDGSPFSVTDYPALYALLGSAITPDLRGYFVRGYDTRNTVDPGGAGREIGDTQPDAGRNVTGTFLTDVVYGKYIGTNLSGACFDDAAVDWGDTGPSSDRELRRIGIDASRVWGASHTATEFRPSNVCLLYCIKHD